MMPSTLQRSSPMLEHVLSQLKGVRTSMRGWKACCPAHADRKPSLSISLGEQGQVLLKCFAGCSLERIVEALGLTMSDLFPDATSLPEDQGTSSGNMRQSTLTLVDLALEKQLPWKFLFHLGIMEQPSGGLHMPYHLQDRQGFRAAFQHALEEAVPLADSRSQPASTPLHHGQPTIFSLPDLLFWGATTRALDYPRHAA